MKVYRYPTDKAGDKFLYTTRKPHEVPEAFSFSEKYGVALKGKAFDFPTEREAREFLASIQTRKHTVDV